MGNVLISSASLPADFCGITQAQWTILTGLLTGQFNRAGTGINFGNDVPTAENEDKPWYRLHPDGRPDRIYNHIDGIWLARFFVDPPFSFWYPGTGLAADIGALHGGEVGAVGDYTGPFWQKMAGFEGRSPIVPATLPSGAVINVGDDYGSEEFSLTALNLPTHFHDIIADSTGAIGGGDGGWVIGTGSSASGMAARDKPASATNPRTGRTENAGELAADIDPVSNVHPVRGIWLLERTNRLYHRFP